MMSDLFGGAAPARSRFLRAASRAEKSRPAMTRSEIVEKFGVSDLKSPRAHKCFRCGASTGLGFGFRGGKTVFACKEHFGELQ
jgi:hypothetical protein